MNNAAATHELNRALARFRRRQDHTPKSYSAREIVQMSMLAEYLRATHHHTDAASAIQATELQPCSIAA